MIAAPQKSRLRIATPSLGIQTAGLRRFSVAEYHEMIRASILGEEDDVELVEGYLVNKIARNPLRDGTLNLVKRQLEIHLPSTWHTRLQSGLTLRDSEPEPDIAVVRGEMMQFVRRHPGPKDAGLLVEVSGSSLAFDTTDKLRIYARAGIPVYWIVNLVDRRLEVHRKPSGAARKPVYRDVVHFKLGEKVPFELDGEVVASIPVDKIIVV